MSRIYFNKDSNIGLYYQKHNADTPYIIKLGIYNILAECDNERDAYRLYNRYIQMYS